jgi:hypothetical protein
MVGLLLSPLEEEEEEEEVGAFLFTSCVGKPTKKDNI